MYSIKTTKRWKRPVKDYTIVWNGWMLYCSCPAWKYQRLPPRDRVCKHILMYYPEYTAGREELYPSIMVGKPDLPLFGDFDESKHKVDNWFWSEKLDGARAVWDGKKHLVTRSGKTVRAPPELLEGLPAGLALDGELWAGRGTFDELQRALQVGPPDPLWKDIRYMVFDTPTYADEPFYERLQILMERREEHPDETWELITQHKVRSVENLGKKLQTLVSQGAEGVVLRNPDALYRKGRNARTGLKWKLLEYEDGTVISEFPKKPGSWIIEAENGARFTITLAEHESLEPNEQIVFSMKGKFADGTPKYPRYERSR